MAGDNKLVQASAAIRIRRRLRFLRTRLRELRMIGKALVSTKHPILVHIIPNRRCNLACTYCNEFDDFSKPVPQEEFENAGYAAGMAGAMRRFSGKYQFRARQRRQKSRRRAENRAPRRGAGIHQHGGNYSRPQWAAKAPGPSRNGNLRRGYDAGEALVFALQRIPAQCGARPPKQLALPLRFALSLYLRG